MTAQITFPSNDRRTLITASAGQTLLTFDFPILRSADIAVYRYRAEVETLLTAPDDYAPPTAGLQAGGSVTLTTAAEAGDIYAIVGARVVERVTDLGPYELDSSDLNTELDGMIVALQEATRKFDSALRLSEFSGLGFNNSAYDVESRRITGLQAAITDSDAVNRGQLSAAIAGVAATPLRGDGYTLAVEADTSVDPGQGQVRLNAAIASATEITISKTNASGDDITAFLRSFADSSSTTKGRIRLHAETAWYEATVTALAELPTFVRLTVQDGLEVGQVAALSSLLLLFVPAGDRGEDAIQGTMPVGACFDWYFDGPAPAGCIFVGGTFNEADWPDLAAVFAAQSFPYGVTGTAPNRVINTPQVKGRHRRVQDEGAGIELAASARLDRGDGTTGDAVGTLTDDAVKAHNHAAGTLATGVAGAHTHNFSYSLAQYSASAAGYDGGGSAGIGYQTIAGSTDQAPNHVHTITGSVAQTGGVENLVKSITVRVCMVADAKAYAAATLVYPFGETYVVEAGSGTPSAGRIRFSDPVAANVTQITLSTTSLHGLDIAAYLASWVNGELHVRRPDDPSIYRVYEISGVVVAAGVATLSVTHVAGDTVMIAGVTVTPVRMPTASDGVNGDSFNWRGAWANNTLFSEDDVVRAVGGNTYIATSTHTSATATEPGVGADAATVWELFVPKGNDGFGSTVVVEDEGSSAVAAATTLNFVGAGVTVTDGGNGEAVITVPAGGTNIVVDDEGTPTVAVASSLNFVGAGVTVTDGGSGEAVITVPAGGTNIVVDDEGTPTVAVASSLNFVGAGVTVTDGGGGEAVVTVPGGGSGGGGSITLNIQKFTGSGTYTPSANMVACTVEAVGGGGAGGGSVGNGSFLTAGGGGGGGEYARSTFSAADIGASKAVVIGGGGAGSSGANGGDGSDTTFGGTLLVASGGSGGARGTSGAFGAGGNGGTGGTGDILIPGERPLYGPYNSGAAGFVPSGSPGGRSQLGPGGAAITSPGAVATAGTAATANTGGGGSASMSNRVATNRAGGAGGAGYLIITEIVQA